MVPKLLKKKLARVKKPAAKAAGKTVKPNFVSNAQVAVKANKLKWKPVDIPDTLGDYEGFYGLEEIDGVDVKIVNGKATFSVKDSDIYAKTLEDDEIKKKETEIPKGDFELDEEDLKKYQEGEEEPEEEVEDDEVDAEEEEAEEEKECVDEAEEAESVDEVIVVKDPEEKDSSEDKITKVKQKPAITELAPKSETNDELNVPEMPKDSNEPAKKKQKKQQQPVEELSSEPVFSKIAAENLPSTNASLPNWQLPNTEFSHYIINALSKGGMETPTDIQKETLPLIFQGNDIIGKAVTGSGKTLAYGIPIVENALISKETGPSGIIFTPTRELASQVSKHLIQLIEESPLHNKTICSLTGGLSIEKQLRSLSYDPKIIITTPGRFLELMQKSNDLAKQFSKSKYLVMDEADRLLLDGQFEELGQIMTLLNNNKIQNHKWQTLVFSATFNKSLFNKLASKKKHSSSDGEELNPNELIKLLREKLKFAQKPLVINASPNSTLSSKITEAMIPCNNTDRDLMLYYFLTIYPGNTIVFTNSIDTVKRLVPTLNMLGISAIGLHSNMTQKQRLKQFENFQANILSKDQAGGKPKAKVMIASDIAARGLDIKGIQYVVHYHLPRKADTYIHRSGRTGRGCDGVSVVLCDPKEASGPLQRLRSMIIDEADEQTEDQKPKVKDSIKRKSNRLGGDLKMIEPDTGLVGQLRHRMDLAGQIAQAEVTNMQKKKERAWMSEAMEDLGVDDMDDEFEDDFLKKDRLKKNRKTISKDKLNGMKKELNWELKQPIRGGGRRSYITGGLDNLAHKMLTESKKRTHGNNGGVAGWLQKDALEELRDAKRRK